MEPRASDSFPSCQRIEDAFCHFARTGEPHQLARAFDATAPELHRVARHLAPDRATAEDLVQATFLEAIESAATFDARRPLLPWLLGILANRVRTWRRSEVRRNRRERAMEEEPADPADQAARREMCELARRQLAALPDPYRQVLRLHLEHGLAAHEIAAVLDRGQATVRKQIARGMDLLRQGLPAGVVVAALFLGRRPSAQRQRWPAAAVRPPVALLGSLLAAGVACLATLGGPQTESQVPVPPVATLVAALPLSVGEPAVRIAAAQDRPAAEAATARLRVRLRWDDGTLATSRGVYAWPHSLPDSFLRKVRARTGEDGFAVLDVPADIESIVYAHAGGASTRVRPGRGATHDVEMTLERGPIVEGRVLDAEGQSVAGASIVLFDSWCEEAARSGADGSYRLRMSPFSPYIAARKDGHASSYCYWPKSKDGAAVLRLDLRLGGAEARLRGRVVDAAGVPIAGARLLAGSERVHTALRRVAQPAGFQACAPLPVSAETGPDGSFDLRSLAPEGWGPSIELRLRALGYAPLSREIAARPGESDPLEITLDPGGRVAGRVIDPEGKPVAGALVMHAQPHYGAFLSSQSWTDAEGCYELGSLPQGGVRLGASKDSVGREAANLQVVAGRVTTWDVQLGTKPALYGRVTDGAGRGLEGWMVNAWYQVDRLNERCYQAKTNATGLFRLPDVGERAYRLSAYGPSAQMSSAELASVTASDSPLSIRIADGRMPSVTLRGRFVDERGAPCRGRVAVSPVAELAQVFDGSPLVELTDGRLESKGWQPGKYALQLALDEARVALGSFEASAGVLDLGTIRVAALQDVAIEVVDGKDVLVPDSVSVTDPEGAAVGNPPEAAASTRVRFAPGRYLVRCRVGDTWIVRALEVRPETRTETLRRQDGTDHEIVVEVGEPLGVRESIRLAIRDASGALRFSWDLWASDPPLPMRVRVNLPAFAGTLAARSRFQQGSAAVSFGPKAPATIELAVR